MNQRDLERDRLRKENHHLRQLLNAFHDRQRVESQSVSVNDVHHRYYKEII